MPVRVSVRARVWLLGAGSCSRAGLSGPRERRDRSQRPLRCPFRRSRRTQPTPAATTAQPSTTLSTVMAGECTTRQLAQPHCSALQRRRQSRRCGSSGSTDRVASHRTHAAPHLLCLHSRVLCVQTPPLPLRRAAPAARRATCTRAAPASRPCRRSTPWGSRRNCSGESTHTVSRARTRRRQWQRTAHRAAD